METWEAGDVLWKATLVQTQTGSALWMSSWSTGEVWQIDRIDGSIFIDEIVGFPPGYRVGQGDQRMIKGSGKQESR